jgi:hypothetical protein
MSPATECEILICKVKLAGVVALLVVLGALALLADGQP